ncbi:MULTISPECIES: ABC transporter substrate-binding protein [unclassified Nonomuraea]|uniref:ABC transporter substrate-binding protein n=1 Tax=unclassified Nonomuraea TaxID=2593643 RepID=UPI0033ED3FEF
MRGNARKARLAVALVAVGAMALTACGGAEEKASTNGKVKLTFNTWLPTQDNWPAIKAAFEKENPDIEIDFIRDEDFDAYRTKLDNKLLADEIPDVYGIQVGASFDEYADFAMPVKDYAGDWIASVKAGSRKETTTTKGVEAAVPILNAGMEFYLYNKTLFDKLGLTLPKTYDDLLNVARTAGKAGYAPFAMGAADTWHAADFFVWLSNQYGQGGDIYKAAEGKIPWDSESLTSAAKDWQKLFTDGVFQKGAVTTTTYPSARDDYFLKRKALAMPTGSWHVGAALSTSPEVPGSAVDNDEIGMAAFPAIGETDAGATSGVDFALAIGRDLDGAKKTAAAKFVKFMAVGTGQQLWVNTLQGFPAANDVSVQLNGSESKLATSSVDLVTEELKNSKYPRKLSVSGKDSLEKDLGVVLQNIANGADPSKELASLNG